MNQNMPPISREETAAHLADALHDDDRIGLERAVAVRIRGIPFGHGQRGKVPQFSPAGKGKLGASGRRRISVVSRLPMPEACDLIRWQNFGRRC